MPKREYQRRFHTPLFPTVSKTTTAIGFKDYMRQYMREMRKLQRQGVRR